MEYPTTVVNAWNKYKDYTKSVNYSDLYSDRVVKGNATRLYNKFLKACKNEAVDFFKATERLSVKSRQDESKLLTNL